MARPWSAAQCDSRRVASHRDVYREDDALWTVQVVRLARLVRGGRQGHSASFASSSSRIPPTTHTTPAAASCARCARCNDTALFPVGVPEGGNPREASSSSSHDLLWQTSSFQEQAPWRDMRQKTLPYFSLHTESGGAASLWLLTTPDCCCSGDPSVRDAHPAALLARTDQHQGGAASPGRSLSAAADHHHAHQANNNSRGSERNGLAAKSVLKKLCQQGQVKDAVELLNLLVDTNDASIEKHVLYCVLKKCVVSTKEDLVLGGQVHALAVKMGLRSDTFLCKHLVRMYAAHGKLREAVAVLEGAARPDAFMWSSIISAHVKQGHPQRAVQLYHQMRAASEVMTKPPDTYVLVAALQACAAARDLASGKQVHEDAVAAGGMEHRDMFVCNSLVDMYAKCGSLEDARTVFDGLVHKDVVTWTAMAAGYANVEGMGHEALRLYGAMHKEGAAVVPNAVTFVCLLLACANVGAPALEQGKHFHAELKRRGFQSDVTVSGSLVNMYVKCGSLEDARVVFDGLAHKTVVVWTAMIAGYARAEGMGREALSLFGAMHKEGVAVPDAVTFVCLLRACASVGAPALGQGRELHSQVRARGLECDVAVGGSLVNMYVKCGSLRDARRVFDGLGDGHKNMVTWSCMISGYAKQEGMGQEALNIYSAMHDQGIAVSDAATFVGLLEACGSVGALQQGRQLHAEIREGGFESDVSVGSCLVKMYAKCGCLKVSRELFDRLPVKNLVTWNALLKACAEHGEGDMAVQCFQELLEQGWEPNKVTYTCLFTACSHAGLVEQGRRYFKAMVEQHRVEPDQQHYNCMVDLLGRSGHLDEAERMMVRRPSSGVAATGSSNAVGWTALLSACKSHGDAELGRRCFDRLVELEPSDSTAYLLLASIYANAGRWDEVDRVERLRKAAGARKVPANACIEVGKEVHQFWVGDGRSHVAATLRKMSAQVLEGGHVPQAQLVWRPVPVREKEDALCGHAEKLALAYGLLNTPDGSTLVVTKNLRMCGDCHSSTKVLSRVERRDIVVRDGHKVHRFHDGACSCRDRP